MSVDVYSICQLKKNDGKIISCYGCCGRDFKTQKEIEKDIDKNTSVFKFIKIPSTLRLLIFRDRLSENPDDLNPSGICSNLVKFDDGIIACPLHKDINKLVSKKEFLAIHKKDLRYNHCDVNFECETVLIWQKLSENQRTEYLEWLKSRSLDTYNYSVKNVYGDLIKEFMDENYNNW